MEDLNQALQEKLQTVLAEGLGEHAMASIKKHVEAISYDIEGDVEYRLKDALAPMLASWVEEMAANTVKAILDGSEDQMRRYLGCECGHWNARSDGQSWNIRPAIEFHPVIHGRLFEHGALALRKAIVEAHRDLISSERILDLEDQVKSLTAQVNQANAKREEMWERLRAARVDAE